MRTTRLMVLGLTGALVLAACGGDSTGSSGGGINNPNGLANGLNGVVGTLNAGPLLGLGNVGNLGNTALDGMSHGHGGGMAAIIGARPIFTTRKVGRWILPQITLPPHRPRLGADGQIVTQGDVIDNTFYGNQYSFNPTSGQYELSGTNGPANGVEFTLYNVDNQGYPTTASGTLEILDLSTPTTSDVGIVVQDLGSTEYANYHVVLPDTYDPVAGTFDLTSGGALSDGTENVAFTFELNHPSADVIQNTVTLDGDNASLDFQFNITDDLQQNTELFDVDVTVAGGNDNLRIYGTSLFDGNADATTYDLILAANGRVFATATQTDASDDAIWEKPNGDPLTNEEQNLLDTIVAGVVFSVLGVTGLVAFTLVLVS